MLNTENIIISYPPDLLFTSTENKIKWIDNLIKEWTKEKQRLQQTI